MSEYERVLSLIEDALAGESDGAIQVPIADLKALIDGRPERDRWVAERAWDEGHLVHGADGWPREDGYCRISGGCIAVNPYRKEQENNNA